MQWMQFTELRKDHRSTQLKAMRAVEDWSPEAFLQGLNMLLTEYGASPGLVARVRGISVEVVHCWQAGRKTPNDPKEVIGSVVNELLKEIVIAKRAS